MRQIKFRAWDTQGNQMVYDLPIFTETNSINEGFEQLEDTEHMVMQFTGLQDSKGVDIYEGDIVEHSDTKGFPSLSIGAIEWDEYRAQFNHSRYSEEYLSGKVLTIIGNIYESPELLK